MLLIDSIFELPKKALILILSLLPLLSYAQDDTTFTKMYQLANEIEGDTTLSLKYSKYEKYVYKSNLADTSKSEKDIEFLNENKGVWISYQKANEIVDYIYEIESENFSETELTPQTNALLLRFNQLESLSLLLNFAEQHVNTADAHSQLIRKKLIHMLSVQMQIIADNTRAWYNYSTLEKRWLKGFQLETANDLFKLGIWQKNNDMDYTGALKISLITDLLKLDLGQPTQSYQAITYGGEVYTPYFKDTSIFIKEDTFNIFDRPHACFQYIGLENHGIAKNFASRWTVNARVGIIGGRFGYNFQLFLHRDVTLSPYPTGWDGQIAYPGRLALQFNGKYERLLLKSQAKDHRLPFVPSYSAEVAVGHFMTYTELGLNLSTHNFKNKNPNQVLPKTIYTTGLKRRRKARWFADINVSARYVFHNTMLEGFGAFETNETSDASFAESSIYFLSRDQIRPVVIFTSVNVGIQFPNFSLFYRNSTKSPEYKSDGFIYTNRGEVLDPNTRWHNYGTIGVAFIL